MSNEVTRGLFLSASAPLRDLILFRIGVTPPDLRPLSLLLPIDYQRPREEHHASARGFHLDSPAGDRLHGAVAPALRRARCGATTERTVGSSSAASSSCRGRRTQLAYRHRRRALSTVRQRHPRRPRPGALRPAASAHRYLRDATRCCGRAENASRCWCTSTASTPRGTSREGPLAAGLRRRRPLLRRPGPLRRRGVDVLSDEQWRCLESSGLAARHAARLDWSLGFVEVHDARAMPPNWPEPGFDDSELGSRCRS